LKIIDETKLLYERDAEESFDSFEIKYRRLNKKAEREEILSHYQRAIAALKSGREIYSNRERALRRFFYKRFMIDPTQPVPRHKLVDLGENRSFDCENSVIPVNWEVLEQYL
jgi:hypothetical protein